MTSNGMDTIALPRRTHPRSRLRSVGALTALLFLCGVVPPLHARPAMTDSPGVAALLRGTPSSAIPLLEREAAAGDGRAAAYLAVARHYGWGVSINEASAAEYAGQGKAAGYAPSVLLGYLEFALPENARELEKAKSVTGPLARKGDSLAQFYFAMASAKDIGAGALVEGLVLAPLAGPGETRARTLAQMRQDPDYVSSTTTKYLRNAHERGFAPASYLLGAFSLKSAADVADVEKAVDLLHAAATRDLAPAATVVAQLIEKGLVIDPALKEGGPAPWYQRAAALGDPDAMHALAMLHISGESVPRNLARAQVLLEQAVAAGRTSSEEDLHFVQSAIADERAEERRRQEQYAAAERARRVREQVALAEREQQRLASVLAQSEDAASSAPRPIGAAPPELSPQDQRPRVRTAAPRDSSPAQAGEDETPSLSQLYDTSLPVLLLKLLALLAGAELLRRFIGLAAVPLSAGLAVGHDASLGERLKLFALSAILLWLVSLPIVFYSLTAYLIWNDYQSRIEDVHVARDVSKLYGDRALADGESADSEGFVLLASPEWLGSGGVAIRLRNESSRGDLSLAIGQCTFWLRNDQPAHTHELIFEFDPPLPAGFGMRSEARTRTALQYEEADYQRAASCEITSALFRVPAQIGVHVADIRRDEGCRFRENSSRGCVRFKVENAAGRAVEHLTFRCLLGYDRNDSWWEDFTHFRREFARPDEVLIPASGTVELLAPDRVAGWPEGSVPRCDVTEVEWR
jgi:TPR repeat protein